MVRGIISIPIRILLYLFQNMKFYDTPTHSDEDKAHTLLNRFVELGGNFVDTANIYASGTSESIIGNWFQR